MVYDFDSVIERAGTSSTKWTKFAPDVLPMWVADMDFAAPSFVLDALRERLAHPVLGYTQRPDTLTAALQGWLAHHYHWHVPEEWIVWIPGVVPALNLACQLLPAERAIMMPYPVYHPFLDLAEHAGVTEQLVPLAVEDRHWTMDFDAMDAARTDATAMVLICNPQNPTGRCYTETELEALAEFVERNDLLLVSDEIHCNIVLDETSRHVPIAAAFPQLAERTISLFAATKVYNIPGVGCAAAVIADEQLRERFLAARRGLVPGIGPLGFAASEVAFNDRGPWIEELNAYLRGNLALLSQQLGDRLARMEGTYLAWIDVSDLALADTESYFAGYGLGISPGAQFGRADHIRLNFGCPRTTLAEGLARLDAALAGA